MKSEFTNSQKSNRNKRNVKVNSSICKPGTHVRHYAYLNFGTELSWAVSFTFQSTYLSKKSPSDPVWTPHLLWKYWCRKKMNAPDGIRTNARLQGKMLHRLVTGKMCVCAVRTFSSDLDCTRLLKEQPHPR